MLSHPAWVRGLKLAINKLMNVAKYVAPCVGAWIETGRNRAKEIHTTVAPCVGAWIETHLFCAEY